MQRPLYRRLPEELGYGTVFVAGGGDLGSTGDGVPVPDGWVSVCVGPRCCSVHDIFILISFIR